MAPMVRRLLRSLPSSVPPLMLGMMRLCCSASLLPSSALLCLSRQKTCLVRIGLILHRHGGSKWPHAHGLITFTTLKACGRNAALR